MKHIMVAANPSGIDTIAHALGPGFDVRYVTSLTQAIRQLSPDVDLLICDVAFSEFRMSSLLQAMSFLGRRPNILCVHAGTLPLDAATVDAWETVSRASGALGFVNLGGLTLGTQTRLAPLIRNALGRPHASERRTQLLQPLARVGHRSLNRGPD
ncbi:hypothetical protein E4K72_01925 [Oxalobacteraceae bacterium OM1]|nr:hypothetical protein E4K72_01925 [Oxalobacteraceae bacterium OM1]